MGLGVDVCESLVVVADAVIIVEIPEIRTD